MHRCCPDAEEGDGLGAGLKLGPLSDYAKSSRMLDRREWGRDRGFGGDKQTISTSALYNINTLCSSYI